MPKKHDNEKQRNICVCSMIRDDAGSKPIAVIQAVRAMNNLFPAEQPDSHPEFEKNLDALIQIRDNEDIEATIRIMAMNTINTMLKSVDSPQEDDSSADDIMKKIRGAKK